MNIQAIAAKSAAFLLAATWIGAATAAPLPLSNPGRAFATAALGDTPESEPGLAKVLVLGKHVATAIPR